MQCHFYMGIFRFLCYQPKWGSLRSIIVTAYRLRNPSPQFPNSQFPIPNFFPSTPLLVSRNFSLNRVFTSLSFYLPMFFIPFRSSTYLILPYLFHVTYLFHATLLAFWTSEEQTNMQRLFFSLISFVFLSLSLSPSVEEMSFSIASNR